MIDFMVSWFFFFIELITEHTILYLLGVTGGFTGVLYLLRFNASKLSKEMTEEVIYLSGIIFLFLPIIHGVAVAGAMVFILYKILSFIVPDRPTDKPISKLSNWIHEKDGKNRVKDTI